MKKDRNGGQRDAKGLALPHAKRYAWDRRKVEAGRKVALRGRSRIAMPMSPAKTVPRRLQVPGNPALKNI
jgi:hypothetical protein